MVPVLSCRERGTVPYSSVESVSTVQESPGGESEGSVQQAGSQHSHDLRLWQSRHWQQASSGTFMVAITTLETGSFSINGGSYGNGNGELLYMLPNYGLGNMLFRVRRGS
jgi:hypothetical protein